MNKEVKAENELLAELQILCSKPGFIHAFSYLCRRDGTFSFVGGIKYEDMLKFYGNARLLRTELSTLHGLMLKSGYNTETIESEKIEEYAQKAEELLEDIHSSMKKEMNKRFTQDNLTNLSMEEFFSHPAALRESIFYSAEEAYDFQYSDFSAIRYENDAEWLSTNIGLNMNEAKKVYESIANNLNNNIEQYAGQKKMWPYQSYLDGFALNIEFLVQDSKLSIDTINAFLSIFSHSEETNNNGLFVSIDAFNIVNPKPISKIGDKYYLFQIYPLTQSMYESPIFWMREDKKYFGKIAQDNRGAFTENFAYEKLKKFLESRMFIQILISTKVHPTE